MVHVKRSIASGSAMVIEMVKTCSGETAATEIGFVLCGRVSISRRMKARHELEYLSGIGIGFTSLENGIILQSYE